jgi:hypothetical protein
MSSSRIVALFLAFLALTGCASRATSLRSQPAVFMDLTDDPKRTMKVPLPALDPETAAPTTTPAEPTATATLASLMITTQALPPAKVIAEASDIEIRCVRTPDLLNSDTAGNGKVKRPQCLYLAIDWQDVLRQPIRNDLERNRIVDLLMNISDSNCTTFMSRVFANKAGLDATRNTGKDIATALAAGTATVASGFSSGIGLFNLVGGTAIDNLNAVLFSEKTFQVISSAIKTERLTTRRSLMEGRSRDLARYSYLEALGDVQAYDQACSLQRGLERLAELANEKQSEAEKNLRDFRGQEVDELREELEVLRSQRTGDQQLLVQAQQELLAAAKAKDQAGQDALKAQVEALQKQIKDSNEAMEKLRDKITSAATDKPAPQPVVANPPAQAQPQPAAGGTN